MARVRLPSRYRRRTAGFWAAFAACWAGGVASLLLLIALLSGGETHEEALASRQRAMVMIETGEAVFEGETAVPPAALPAREPGVAGPGEALTSTPLPGSFGGSGDAVEMPASRPEPLPQPEPTVDEPANTPLPGADEAPLEPAETGEDPPALDSEIPLTPRQSAATTPTPLASGLTPAPQPDLTEQSDAGSLPVAASEERASWRVYGRPSKAAPPVVAIVVTNLGLGNFTSEQALKLPLDTTLAFSPYGRQSPAWAAKARDMGFEVMLELPAEPADYPRTDPGPYALLGSLSPEENRSRLHWVLARFPGYVGVVTAPESSLHRHVEQADYLATEVARRGLIWLQGAVRADRPTVAGEATGMVVQADIVLDDTLTDEAILTRLGELGALAKRQGTAIAIARPYPLTLDNVAKWLGRKDQAVRIAPLSAVAAARQKAIAPGQKE